MKLSSPILSLALAATPIAKVSGRVFEIDEKK